jgi:chromosomal replication initiator protein
MTYEWQTPLRASKRLNRKTISDREIIERVCFEFGCTEEELLSDNRERRFVVARDTVAFLLRKHLGFTLKSIATLLNRDHSTILIALRRVDDLFFTKDSIAKVIKTIETNLYK